HPSLFPFISYSFLSSLLFFFFNDPAPTEIYTLSLHDALPICAFAVPALALIGTLAVACFVKVYGAVFLGMARSDHVQDAHESGLTMIAPMAVLAFFCFLIGLAPALAAPMLDQAIAAWAGQSIRSEPPLAALAPLGWISAAGVLLVALLLGGAILLRGLLRGRVAEPTGTWDCGYAAPSPRMQYTASSFAQMLVGLFSWALWPRTHEPH